LAGVLLEVYIFCSAATAGAPQTAAVVLVLRCGGRTAFADAGKGAWEVLRRLSTWFKTLSRFCALAASSVSAKKWNQITFQDANLIFKKFKRYN
jgi:hypothetical protein